MLTKTIQVVAVISNVAALAFLGFTAYWLWSLSKEDRAEQERKTA